MLQGSLFVVLTSNVVLVLGLQGSSAPGSPKSARPVLLPRIHFCSKGAHIHVWLQLDSMEQMKYTLPKYYRPALKLCLSPLKARIDGAACVSRVKETQTPKLLCAEGSLLNPTFPGSDCFGFQRFERLTGFGAFRGL